MAINLRHSSPSTPPHSFSDGFLIAVLSEKFDTDLMALLPPDEKHYLNPRLSISTAFLSRFQDRIRSDYPQSSVIGMTWLWW